MPRFEVDLSDAALDGLQRVVARYNADNGTALTVADWIHLHLKEVSVQDDLLRAADDLRRQAEETAAAALRAERQRLLDSVA
jgi:hypothetical protein